MNTYLVDLHVHTAASPDGRSPLADLATAAKQAGLDAMAICDHDLCTPVPEALEGVLLIPACEVSTRAGHIAGLFLDRPLDLEALGLTARQVADTLAAAYAGGPVVAVHPLNEGADGGFLASNALAGSDRLEIFCLADPEGRQMQLISRFDNLGKGSSGAAVQCMNLMLGLDECAGLAL